MTHDEEEFQRQLKDAHDAEHRAWCNNTITIEYFAYIASQEKDALEKMRKYLCSTPAEVDKAAKQAVRSQTLQEILEYARRR